MRGLTMAIVISLLSSLSLAAQEGDPYLWLEDIDGEKAMSWVREQNARSLAELKAVAEYKSIYTKSLEIYDSQARIPAPDIKGDYVYNFWQDNVHERGIWRRTTVASYRTSEPAWETVIDLDALSKSDGQPWSFKGATFLPPEYRRCIVRLSRGGGDAVVQREFDVVTRKFVDGGFTLPEAKSFVEWRDLETVWVGTDFGEGSLTSSGYPRVVKLWKRGTPLSEAVTLYEGRADDVSVAGFSQFTPEGRYDLVYRGMTFYSSHLFLVLGDRLVRLAIPEDASFQGLFRDHALFSLRSSWKVGDRTFAQGSLLAGKLDDLLRSTGEPAVLFEPSERSSLDRVSMTRDRVLVTTMDNVRSRLQRMTFDSGAWSREEVPLPGLGTASIVSASEGTDVFFYDYQDFLTPTSLFLFAENRAAKVKSAPAFFKAEGMRAEQFEATAKDGTKIPYFVVTPRGFKPDGKAPALLYAYGGFEVAEQPWYGGALGSAWMARGGVYVLANIRGGGEFGPRWHDGGVKQNHINCFEDFIAVAEELVDRKITSPRHLGIMGGSNGGLLVGTTFIMRPDLFGAVVSQVPLLDMKRYHKLLAGASWMSEYGDPDKPEEWAFISTWSPYQLVKAGAKYPKAFFWTTTRDDRVHPGHARKMVARMQEQGHPVYYFENVEGGHGAGAVNKQRATTTALEYSYLWKMLR